MKKTILIITMVFLVLVMGMTCVNAESGSARLSAGKSTVKRGDTVTVTVSFSPMVTSAAYSITYDPSIMQFISGGPAGSNVNSGSSVRTVYMSYDENGISRASYSFKAIADGTANFGISMESATGGAEDNELAMSCSGTSITVSTPVTPPPTQPDEPTVVTPNFRSDNSTVYSTASLNVRSSCTTETSSNIIGSLPRGASITRTGISDEWDRVNYNGITAYIKHGYLSTEKPEEDPDEPNTEDPEQPTEEPPTEPKIPQEPVKEKEKTDYEKIVEEKLPKVGEIIEKIKQINKDYKGETKDGVIARYEKEKTQLVTIVCVETVLITILIIFVTYMNSGDTEFEKDRDKDKKKKKKKSVSGKRTKKNTIKYKGR